MNLCRQSCLIFDFFWYYIRNFDHNYRIFLHLQSQLVWYISFNQTLYCQAWDLYEQHCTFAGILKLRQFEPTQILWNHHKSPTALISLRNLQEFHLKYIPLPNTNSHRQKKCGIDLVKKGKFCYLLISLFP